MYFTTILLAGLLATGSVDTLKATLVVADKGVIVSKTDTLTIGKGSTITETLRQSPGLVINDNGGDTGLKTVSLRGLGSPHTAIYIDGVKVGNVQSGQADLGSLGYEQYSQAVVDYAQNSISLSTAKAVFEDGRKFSGEASVSGGSFGTWKPYGRLNFKLSDKVSLCANTSGLVSKGNFEYGEGQKRENNDIKRIVSGIDLFGMTNGGKWQGKVQYSGSDRGTPGSLNWPSTDRQSDRNVFIQGHIEQRFSGIYSLTGSLKYAFDRIDYKGDWIDSRYDQNECQVNTAHKFTVTPWLELSLAADIVWDKLNSTECQAERWSPTAAVAAAFRTKRFKANLAVEYDGAIDKDGLSRHVCSPSADLRYRFLNCLELNAFSRRAYRVPTFNELYYVGYGNPELRPEDAWLNGLGLGLDKSIGNWTLKASTDAFLYLLSDKIISAPTQADPNLWLPYNIGKVRSSGIDANAGFIYRKNDWLASLMAKYSYQSAIDKTEGSSTFGEQIPYVAKNTFNLNCSVGYRTWRTEVIWNLRSGRKDSYGEMPDWNTLDAIISKEFRMRTCGPLTVFINGKNLNNCKYESVSGYPMPGISLTGGISFKF